MSEKQLYEKINKLILCDDLNEMMDVAYDIIGLPFFITDRGHNVLLHTKHGSGDERWEKIVLKEDMPTDEIKKGFYREDRVVMSSQNAKVFKNTYAHENQIKKRISYGDIIIGIMIVISKDTIDQELVNRVDLVGNILASKLVPNNGMLNDIELKQKTFLTSLLLGTVQSKEKIKRNARALQINLSKDLYFCLVQSMEEKEETHLVKMFENIENCISFIFEHETVLLLMVDEADSAYNRMCHGLSEIFKKTDLVGALSNPFHDLMDAKIYYWQAKRIHSLRKQLSLKAHLYSFQEFVLYDLFEHAPKSILKEYIHRDIQRLYRYDKENNTELCLTLLIYLDKNQSQLQTAKELFIHRNTVNYRIGQCEEIIGYPIRRNKKMLMQYKISLHVLEYLGELHS